MKHVVANQGIFNVRGLGLINTYTLELDNVFVDLRIMPSGNPQRARVSPVDPGRYVGAQQVWDFSRAIERSDDNGIALAIIGPPGSGKTTLLQHMAISYAANRQRRHRVRSRVPIFLHLRDHTSKITVDTPPSLGQLCQTYFSEGEGFQRLKPPDGWFERQLSKGKCAVFLDGLDEVADLSLRQRVSAWVDRQIADYGDCMFIVSSRPQGYTSAPLQRADVLEVQPFSAGQVTQFIHNWYLANEVRASGNEINQEVRDRAESDARRLMDALYAFPSIGDLTVNPLLLTMVAMVHRYHGALPGSRVALYSEITEVMLERWRQAVGVPQNLNAAQKRTVLQPLAAHMMDRQMRDISTQEAALVVSDSLGRVGVADDGVEEFFSDLEASSGMIFEREVGQWSFAHLTFQEYLASRHWIEERQSPEDLTELIGDSWWQETLRLVASQGDASALLKACMDANTVPTLRLAADILDEARELDIEVRRDLTERLVSDLESEDDERRHLAAGVQLARRIESFHRIDDDREIDMTFVTYAEYQLFLDEQRQQGAYHQPDHWTQLEFSEGQALDAVVGVRPGDAVAWCEWLSNREGGRFRYRLPTIVEAQDSPVTHSEVGAWCTGDFGETVVVMPAMAENVALQRTSQIIGQISVGRGSIDMLSILALDLALALDPSTNPEVYTQVKIEIRRLMRATYTNFLEMRLAGGFSQRYENESLRQRFLKIISRRRELSREDDNLRITYAALKVIVAREEGELHAWEGIRVVRERVRLGEGV